MNITRRNFFIGGCAGALGAFSGCRFFSTAGFMAGGKPKVRFGVVSDIHITKVGADEKMSAWGNNLTFILSWVFCHHIHRRYEPEYRVTLFHIKPELGIYLILDTIDSCGMSLLIFVYTIKNQRILLVGRCYTHGHTRKYEGQ